ncbi:hypothetical protein DPMN_175811 [Dreissena polymorpha]|uniref:P/Homo B domain-containing protein n=2 Tax=Dreissena polymorpha TaxID=45954 RepID=A0A9D4E5U1_DREPO|nr:hypothetical protein DPMN_175811 [Dreissena polymorpha]
MFRINTVDVDYVKKALKVDYSFLNEIMPEIYVFRHRNMSGALPADKLHQTMLNANGKIKNIEQVKEVSLKAVQSDEEHLQALTANSRPQKFGMGIEEAWAENRTGQGITVAILDVGVNIKHELLTECIDKELSRNFVSQSSDVRPDYQMGYKEFLSYADHGTNMCGIIAASGDTRYECDKGIANKAKVAVYKIATVDALRMCRPCMAMDHVASGLSFMQNKISIFTNGFAFQDQFQESDFAINDAIEKGSINGRYGRGSLYLFPSGELGNGLANNPFTIVVSSVGYNGSVPNTVSNSAAVLTSAMSAGKSVNTKSLMTTSGKPGMTCEKFGGSSAATAIVSAIAALVLQTNPQLTRRDVMHILVRSSEHQSVTQGVANFHRNGAGFFYHGVFGFGLLNAQKATTLAASWKPVESLVVVDKTSPSTFRCNTNKCTINVTCADGSGCVTKVEDVRVRVTFGVTDPSSTRLLLTSPSGTRSVLIDTGQVNSADVVRDVWMRSVNFWGEDGTGVWTVELDVPDGKESQFTVSGFTLYGIGIPPLTGLPFNDSSIPLVKRSALGASLAVLYPVLIFTAAGLFFYYKMS